MALGNFPSAIFINKESGEQDKRILDSALAIIATDGTEKIFHLECQSTSDGSMLLRIFEYDTQIALKTSSFSTPDKMTIKVNSPDKKSLSYKIPILKLRNYDCDIILEKELYFLIPFYLFNFEADFDKIEAGDMTVTESFRKRFSELYERLKERLEDGRIDVMTHHSIIMLTKKVIAALAKSKSTVKEEADKIMGGQVLDYETKAIFREGLQQGREQGFESGKVIARFEDGMSIEEIAEKTKVSIETVKSILTKEGLI